MSYDTDRYRLRKRSGQSLAVIECGIQICHPGHATPKKSYKTYAVHFILEGKGSYTVHGKTYRLGAGQGFMIRPNTPNSYVADEKEPWKYVYAVFCGADDDALVHHAGLGDGVEVFDFPLDDDMIRDIYAMHAAGKRNEARGYDLTGYFLLCMSRLVRSNSSSEGETEGACERYLRQAMLYVEDHYSEGVTVEEIASAVGLDRTYLYRIFRAKLGVSPREYLLGVRLERAADLLRDSELPIAEVGAETGFHDASHFYKSFSSKYGVTPKQYRLGDGGES